MDTHSYTLSLSYQLPEQPSFETSILDLTDQVKGTLLQVFRTHQNIRTVHVEFNSEKSFWIFKKKAIDLATQYRIYVNLGP